MKLAVFDFDGTMFPGNSMPYIWKQYGKKGYSKSRQLWALMKIQTDKFLCRKVFKDEVGWRYKATVHMFNLFVGMNDNEIREFFMLIRDEVISELNDEIVEKIQWHKDNGYEIVFLSGGFEVLLEMIGLHFGTARVKATPFVYGLDGRFMKVTAKDPLMTMNGNLKKPYLETFYSNKDVDWEASYAYADNETDAEMMGLVGNPVGVNPDSKLKECCEEQGWTVLVC